MQLYWLYEYFSALIHGSFWAWSLFLLPFVLGAASILFDYAYKPYGLFSFVGRMNRQEYIKRFLISIVLGFIFGFGFGFFGATNSDILSTLCLLILFFVLIYSLAAMAKRYHDLNFSGWFCVIQWLLALFFNSIGSSLLSAMLDLIVIVPLCFIKGTVGDNKYGADPLAKTKIT
jgi:uncharacterized membrane protein YhaH (DUF805 family)